MHVRNDSAQTAVAPSAAVAVNQCVLTPATLEFYLRSMDLMDRSGLPYLLGGAYALRHYAGIERHTKDLDLFVRPRDFPSVLALFEKAGYRTETTHPHWLGKAYEPGCGEDFIDLIFGAGNGIAVVDDEWFEFAVDGEALGRPARLMPAEEMIWSKSFIQERERYDGADIAHLLRGRADHLDWDRLLRRFDGHEPVLLAHLLLFGYVYPADRARVPDRVIETLFERARTAPAPAADEKLCRGTFLSWQQYLVDVREWGYRDARLQPHGPLAAEQVERWTAAPK
jgi:hypothetical protein